MLGCWHYVRSRGEYASFYISAFTRRPGIGYYEETSTGVRECDLQDIGQTDDEIEMGQPIHFLGRIYSLNATQDRGFAQFLNIALRGEETLYVQTRLLRWDSTQDVNVVESLSPLLAFSCYETCRSFWEPQLSPMQRVAHAIKLVRIRRLLDLTRLWHDVSTEIDLWLQVSRKEHLSEETMQAEFRYAMHQLYVAVDMCNEVDIDLCGGCLDNEHASRYYRELLATLRRAGDESDLYTDALTWLLPEQGALLTFLETVTPDGIPPNIGYRPDMNTQTGAYVLCKECNAWLRDLTHWESHVLCKDHIKRVKLNYFCASTACARGETPSYMLWGA